MRDVRQGAMKRRVVEKRDPNIKILRMKTGTIRLANTQRKNQRTGSSMQVEEHYLLFLTW
jgi:hypothetical protein